MKTTIHTHFNKVLLLAVMMMTNSLPANAYDFMVDNLAYNINSDDSTTVSVVQAVNGNDVALPDNYSYLDTVKLIEIPTVVSFDEKVYTVTMIGESAFQMAYNIEEVILPNTIIEIGKYAFVGCSNLRNINLPNSLKTIKYTAFSGCSVLENIVIPESVVTIEGYAFYRCHKLTSITIPSSVKQLGPAIFAFCANLTTAEINNDFISSGQFSSCPNLKNVYLSNSVLNIGKAAFSVCNSLQSITIPESIISIGEGSFDGCAQLSDVVWNVPQYTSNDNFFTKNVKNITLGENVEILPYNFLAGTEIDSLYIPRTLKNLNYAFNSCQNLKRIVVDSNNPTFDSRENCNAVIATANDSLALGCKSSTILPSIKHIGNYAFNDCVGLENLDFPDGIETLGEHSFANISVDTIVLPSSVKSIGYAAFSQCKNLKYVIFPKNLKYIGENAFKGCRNLIGIQLPDSLISIFTGAFRDCSSLKKLYLPSSSFCIGSYVFYGCSGLTDIYSLMKTPCMLYSNSFDSSGYSATLHVPAGTADLYQNIEDWLYEGWNYFTNIVEMENEDVNMDGAVNTADITFLYNYLLYSNSKSPFYGDVNEDGEITTADITAIYNNILGNQ